MSIENKNLIAGTNYDIYSKMIHLASKYTDVQNEDFLKSGLFGYVTECMAMIMRDSSIHNTMLYNESFLNTAVIPKSVYNWAKMFNININSATPSYADISITIGIQDFENYRKKGSEFDFDGSRYGKSFLQFKNDDVLVIDKSNNFVAGAFNFMLEHSIMIKQLGVGKYFVQYIMDEEVKTTEYEEIVSPILPTTFYTDNYGNEFLTINARVYQYKIQKFKKVIPSSSFLDRKIHEFEFTDQFVAIYANYIKGSEKKKIDLRYSNVSEESVNPVAFYSLNDTNRIQLKFADTTDGFKPAANSTLEVSIITSKGGNGNISYSGDVLCRLNEESLRNLPLLVSFTDSKASGGINSPTLSSIKQKIVNEISTRDVIVTETDLNNYFNTLTILLESINNGEVKFVKKRDDILRRIFSAYVLLKGSQKDEFTPPDIGTNTVDVILNGLGNENISLPFGQPIEFNTQQKKYATSVNSTANSYPTQYMIPFYVYISKSNPIRVKYIYNLTSDSTSLVYRNTGVSSVSSSSAMIIPSSVKVERLFNGNSANDSYTFSFTFTTNFNSMPSNGKYRIYFKNKTNGTINVNEYFEFDTAGSEVSYDFKETQNGTGEVFTMTISFPISVAEAEFNFDGESPDYGSSITLKNKSGTLIKAGESIIPILEFDAIKIGNAELSSSFEGTEALGLYRNLDSIMSSDIVKEKQNDSSTLYTLKDVPVLVSENETGFDNADVEAIVKQLFIYINMLKENLEKLESNTFFDLKFYNSRGYSIYHNSPKTDLNLNLLVRLKNKVNVEDYEAKIRRYVQAAVDNSNKEGVLKISHIITSTVAYFNDVIENIDFEGIDGTFLQYIRPISIPDKLKSGLVPEHFNIPDKYLENIKVVSYDYVEEF